MRPLPSLWLFLLLFVLRVNGQSSNQSFNLLGSDFALSLGGGLVLTPDLADSTPNCQLQHTLLQECLLAECRTFTRQCPASNTQTQQPPPTTSTLTCEGISETICTTYENCCMTECALELQTWAICIHQETSIGASDKGLSCGVPTCNDQNSVIQTGGSNETDTNAANNETTTNNNETSTTTTNTTTEDSEPTTATSTTAPTEAGTGEPECEYIDNGQRVVCSHFFNITSATTKTNTKLAEAILECAAPPSSSATTPTVDFILEAPNSDCSCLGTTLWGIGDVIEECQCDICRGSLRIELFECTTGGTANGNPAFVIDDCVEQTCEGECVRLEVESEPPSSGPTLFPTTIQPSTTAPTTIQPSTVAPSSTMPSLVPTVSYTTMAPSTGIVVFTPSPTANVFPPPGPTTPNAPTSPPTMSGQTALPSLGLDQSSIPPSVEPSAAPSLAPSVTNSNNTTTNSPTTTSNTTTTATTQSPVPRPDTSTTTTTTSTTPPPITNALRQQSTLVAVVGALVGTVGLIVVLVVTKKGSVGELTRARDASAARQKMAQMASNRHIFSSKSSRDINSAAATASPTSSRGLPVSSRGMPGAVNGHGNGHRGGGVV